MHACPCRTFRTRLPILLGVVVAACLGLTRVHLSYAQVSPEEHKKHHPGPASSDRPNSGSPEGMEGMGEHGRTSQPKELYPSLMSLPELTVEQRGELERQAQ